MFIAVQVRNSTQLPGAKISAYDCYYQVFCFNSYLPGEMIQFDAHIFQMGGSFNHQLYHILAMEIGHRTDLMILRISRLVTRADRNPNASRIGMAIVWEVWLLIVYQFTSNIYNYIIYIYTYI